MITPVIRKLEITFWDIFINLATNSKQIRNLLKEFLALKQSHQMKRYAGILVAGCLFGFLLGFTTPQLVMLVR